MSCYACAKKYGFFCKEAGCPNCGFSFCTKCLKKTIKVPKCNNEERKVCLSCYEKIVIVTKEIAPGNVLSPSNKSNIAAPSNPLDVNDLLDAPIPSDECVPDVDDEIKKRLEVLKQRDTNNLDESPLSDDAISKRLANLKDMPDKKYDNKAWLTAVDKRSEQERAHDLMEQYMKEASIDSAVNESADDALKDIERRLNALKGDTATPATKITPLDDSNEHEDDDTVAKKIVTKYLDEAALPDADLSPEEKEFVNSIKPEGDTEELPWCTICNEDATIRCTGCDGDLFCGPCFKEIHHDDEEYRQHKTKQYIAKEIKS